MAEFRFAVPISLFTAAFIASAASGPAQPSIDLDQNWSEQDENNWYDAPQGSRLIPLSWLQALEQPDGTGGFLADDHIAKFRYIPRPGKLPIGFAIDATDDRSLSVTRLRWKSGQSSREAWVGFNCATCHTGEITFKGEHMLVQGGAALADFQSFTETLNRSLIATRDHEDKFQRFANGVLRGKNTRANRTLLKAALAQLIDWQIKVERMNATDLRYGYGRLDAFGQIFNKVVLVANPTKAAQLKPLPSDAPVSYPFLWNAPQLTLLQWNAVAPNHVLPKTFFGQPFDVGQLMQNVSEVVGVFGDVKPTAHAGLSGYKSSVNIGNLVSLQQMLTRLRPPAWPAIFGLPDPALVATGKQLFEARCQRCHASLDRTDLQTTIKISQTKLRDTEEADRTDPWMTCNAYSRRAPTGLLQGVRDKYLVGDRLGSSERVGDMTLAVVAGTILNQKGAVAKTLAASTLGLQRPPQIPIGGAGAYGAGKPLSPKEESLHHCLEDEQSSPGKDGAKGYKARPLNGIWATAPYLHNGSVPSLYDLLLPPEQRPKLFYLGSREFDPEKVGLVSTGSPDNSFLFRTQDASGKMIDGNSNAGHDFNKSDNKTESAEDQEKDRQALLAYLKTL